MSWGTSLCGHLPPIISLLFLALIPNFQHVLAGFLVLLGYSSFVHGILVLAGCLEPLCFAGEMTSQIFQGPLGCMVSMLRTAMENGLSGVARDIFNDLSNVLKISWCQSANFSARDLDHPKFEASQINRASTCKMVLSGLGLRVLASWLPCAS